MPGAPVELDTVEGALKGNKEGPVLVPGKPAESKIIAVLGKLTDRDWKEVQARLRLGLAVT